jgi:hypothetical protein
MKTTYLIILLALAAILPVSAEIPDNAGEYGYQFLDVSTNPISLALAGRGIISGNELASFLRQPASPVKESHRSLGVSHSMWIGDTSYNSLFYSYSTRKSHFGVALRNLDYGELEIRDDNGFLIGYYSPLNMDLTGNYSLRLSPSIYAGINAGIAYEKLDTDSSLGVHSDLGITLLPPINNVQFSLAVRNLGISTAMNTERTLFAPSLEMDLSKHYDFAKTSLDVELSGIKAIDENWKAALSAQITIYDIIKLRMGYKFNYDAEDISAGLGIKWKNFGIDYGWADYTSHLNDVHSLGVSYYF